MWSHMRVQLRYLQGDPVMDPTGTGTKILPFTRSAAVRSKDGLNTREAVNGNTHFIDGSMVRVTRGHLSCPCLFKALRWDGHLTGRRGRLIVNLRVCVVGVLLWFRHRCSPCGLCGAGVWQR